MITLEEHNHIQQMKRRVILEEHKKQGLDLTHIIQRQQNIINKTLNISNTISNNISTYSPAMTNQTGVGAAVLKTNSLPVILPTITPDDIRNRLEQRANSSSDKRQKANNLIHYTVAKNLLKYLKDERGILPAVLSTVFMAVTLTGPVSNVIALEQGQAPVVDDPISQALNIDSAVQPSNTTESIAYQPEKISSNSDMNRYSLISLVKSQPIDPTTTQVVAAVTAGLETQTGSVSTPLAFGSEDTDAPADVMTTLVENNEVLNQINENDVLIEAANELSPQTQEQTDNSSSSTESNSSEESETNLDSDTNTNSDNESADNKNLEINQTQELTATVPVLTTVPTDVLNDLDPLQLRMSIAVADKEVKNHIKEELEAEAYAKSAKGKAEAAIKEQEEINQAIIEAAKTQLGVPYVWGGITPRDFDDEGNALNEGGLDCSSLVQYCYRQIGIETGRTTWDQYDNAYRITSIDEAEPGDILFRTNASGSSQHVSIYVGNGQYIHAPRRNTVVQYGDDPYSFQKCLKFTDDVPYYLLDELEEEK